MPVNYSDCIEKAKGALNEFGEEDLNDYILGVMRKAREFGDLSSMDRIRKAIDSVHSSKVSEMLFYQQMMANDAKKFDRLKSEIIPGKKTLRDLVSTRYWQKGINVEERQRFYHEQLDAALYKNLGKEHIEYLSENRNQDEIARAYDGKDVESPLAKDISKALKQYFEYRNTEMVKSNAMSLLWINEDRTFRAIHDTNKMLKEGQYKWSESIKRHVNMEKTFRNTDAIDIDGKVDHKRADELLNEMYRIITQDDYSNAESRKLVSRMFFTFKDMESQLKYNEDFGRGNLLDAMNTDIHASGNNIGSANIFGNDPFSTYQQLLEHQMKVDPKSRNWQYYTRKQFDDLMGLNKTSVNPRLSTYLATTRALTSAARSTQLVARSLNDFSYMASYAQRHEMPYWGSLVKDMAHIFNLMPSEERAYFAKTMKRSLDVHQGYIGRFIEAQNLTEFSKKASAFMFHANGMQAFDKGNKLSNMAIVSDAYYKKSHLSYDELSPLLKKQLEKHNIEPSEWDVLRKNNKRQMFTVDNVLSLSKDQVRDLWEKSNKSVSLSDYKTDLHARVYSIFDEASQNAVLFPTAFIRSYITGEVKGSYADELWHSFFQYKGFGIQYLDKVLYQGWKDMDGPTAKVMWAANLAAGTLPLSYLSASLLALASGKSAPDPFKMNKHQAAKFYSEMLAGHLWYFTAALDPRNQGGSVISNTIFNAPNFQFHSHAISTLGAAASLNPKKALKEAYKTGSYIAPYDNVPVLSPYLRQMIGMKGHHEPGTTELYGK